jgi:serine protease inhibitor
MAISRLGAAAALLTLTTACGEAITGPGEPATPITELPRTLSVAERAVIGASNRFAADLLRRVHQATPHSTAFLSPLSASMALGMTMNGATGATYTQMRDMLGFGGLSADEINASYRDLITLLGDLDPHVELAIANAIFHRETFAMEAAFLALARDYFDAAVEGLDFDSPAAVEHINAWVRDATQDRIDGIVEPPIDPLTMAFLMNAIYFKGDWTKSFDASDTYSGPFHLGGGGTETVRFMTKEDTLRYRSTEAWHAAELPYGGRAWVMTVAVPRDGHTLDAVLSDLETLLDPEASWSEPVMRVHLPRFELDWERVLNDDLQALGMIDAFDPMLADFTPMYARAREDELHVKSVKQKTFLRVDEVGTEAAAVTVVEMGITSCCSGPPELKADRPFVLAIRERFSGTVLFAGAIVEAPTE